jgi:hypothetical protein
MFCDAVLSVCRFSGAVVWFAMFRVFSFGFPPTLLSFLSKLTGSSSYWAQCIFYWLFVEIIQIHDYVMYFGYMIGAVYISQYIMAITPVSYAPVLTATAKTLFATTRSSSSLQPRTNKENIL